MMNKDDLINKLENLSLPEVEVPGHERRLKEALLGSGYWKRKRTLSLLKKAIPVGGIVIIGMIAAVIVLNLRGTTPVASAQEIAQKSYQAVANMSQDELLRLRQTTMGEDPKALLEEAQNAEDLKLLTYADIVSQNPKLLPPDPEGKFQSLSFLQFTGKEGGTVTVGLDSNNLPAVTTEIIAGTRDPNGNCTARFSAAGNTHGTANLIDPANCKYLQTQEPGPGPGPLGGPSNEELTSGGPCSPQKIMQSWKNAKDVTVLTYDEFMAETAAKYNMQFMIKAQDPAHDPAIDAQIRNWKFQEFTDTDGSKMVVVVNENSELLWWASLDSHSGSCSGASAAIGGPVMSGINRPGVPEPPTP